MAEDGCEDHETFCLSATTRAFCGPVPPGYTRIVLLVQDYLNRATFSPKN